MIHHQWTRVGKELIHS